MYTEELPDVVKPSAVIVAEAQLVPVVGHEKHYQLREEDKEAAVIALAECHLEGHSNCMAVDAEGDDDDEL